MKILVTGANGYIGSHVVNELVKHKHEVLVIDKSISNLPNEIQRIDVDLFENNSNIYEKAGQPDVLLHMAWRDGFNHMAETHVEDFSKHVRFLENMISGGLKHVAVMGTMHEVGYFEGSINEHTPCNPKSYYGITKNALRQVLEILCSKNDVTLQWIRAYYIYGDDTRSNSIFGKLMSADQNGDKEFPLNSGKNLYDFIHVEELAKQIACTIEQEEITGVINCCTGKPVSLLEQVKFFIEKNNLDIELKIGAFADRPYDSPGVWGDSTKINEIMKGCKDV